MRFKVLSFLLFGSLFLTACQVKVPFFKESKYSVRAPASIGGESKALQSQEFPSQEIDLARSICQDLRSFRFNRPFISSKDKERVFDMRHFSCDGTYKEKLGQSLPFDDKELFFSGLITDEQGPISQLCAKLLHGEDVSENMETLPTGELIHYRFFLNENKQKVFSVVHSFPDSLGAYVAKEKETFYLGLDRDAKSKGLVVKQTKEVVCPQDPEQGMERFEQENRQ